MNDQLVIDSVIEKIKELIQKVSTNSPWNQQPTEHFMNYLQLENTHLARDYLDECDKIRLFRISFNNILKTWRQNGSEKKLDSSKQYFAMANVLSAEFTPIIDPPKIPKLTKSANFIK